MMECCFLIRILIRVSIPVTQDNVDVQSNSNNWISTHQTGLRVKKGAISARHAGLDPASRNVALCKSTGFRVKPGMTIQQFQTPPFHYSSIPTFPLGRIPIN
jgi:hypothetical protein